VRNLKVKQNENISVLEFRLKEMLHIKDHFKANRFNSNTAFNKNSFGEIKLHEFSLDQFKSKIFNSKQSRELIKLCEFSPSDKWELLYCGSLHGFGLKDFHSHCDGKSETLTIIQAKESSYIFGGYTNAAWESKVSFIRDPKAFIFSLTNKENEPIKINIDPDRIDFALYSSQYLGPTFGNSTGLGSDIYIAGNADANTTSDSGLSTNYKHPKYPYGSEGAKTFLAGSHTFQISEIEVYKKNPK
jgi:hypothetical protein